MQTQPSVQSSGAAHVTGPARVLSARRRAPCAIDRWLLRALLRAAGSPPIRCVLPDGEARLRRRRANRSARVRFRDRRALLPRVCATRSSPSARATRTAASRSKATSSTVVAAAYGKPRASAGRTPAVHARNAPRPNSLAGSRNNIHRHYDLGNDFYRLWLDERMVYTCAYFPTPDATLEEAQVAKMDHVCRKVALRPGERVVEAGCGWGSLALHMARHYGVTVRAFNISHEQIAYGREQAEREGLDDRVEFIEDDYRNITGTYDCFMSVGMLEHVGAEPLPRARRGHRPHACRRTAAA